MKRLSPVFIICILFCAFGELQTKAQFFSSGNEPFGVRWRYIETDKLKVIFPSSLDTMASRFANMVESYYPYLSATMTPRSARMPVIFHNQNVMSNGFVTWGPKRMEVFTTPSRDYYAQNWMQGMALHEYRHVLQADRMNTGLTKLFTFFAGQVAIGLPVAQIPLWFIEGDAVIAETMFGAGRGTLPTFEMPFKAYVLEYEKKTYDKSYFGSLKNYVPDYYKSGYFMVAYSKLKYDKNIWNHAVAQVGKFPLLPWSLNSTLKKTHNTTIKEIHQETIDSLKYLWNNQYNNINLTNHSNILTEKPTSYTSYRYPHLLHDGSLIAYKSSIDDLDKIVRLDRNGKESVLHIPGNVYEGRLSCGNNLLVWEEVVSDLRWHHRNYSVIKSLDIRSGEVKVLTKKTRYFSPCISPDENKIALVETDLTNNCSLIVIDTKSGNEIFSIAAPEHGTMNFPVWFDSNTVILIFTTLNHGKLIYMYDFKQNKWSKITEASIENISQLTSWKNYLIFSAGYSGIDNIYALNVLNKELFQVTSSRYGAFDPYIYFNSDTLYYSNYTKDGYMPVKKKLDFNNFIPFEKIQYSKTNWAEKLAVQEFGGFQESVLKDTAYSSRPYSRFKGLINIHSWAPFYIEPQFDSPADAKIKPGVIILSQNKLNTAISSFGISYEDKNLIFRPSFNYSGFFPVFDFTAKIGGANKHHSLPADIIPKDSIYPFENYYLRSYIPIRIYNSKFYKFIMPEIDVEYENTLFYNNELRKGIFFLHYRLMLYRYLILNRQDIYPRWGQLFSFTYTHTPFEKSQYGTLMSGTATFYNPGLFRHHSIAFRTGIQYQHVKNGKFYAFNRITLPRGYLAVVDAYVSEMMTKLSVDYNFPFVYPDFSFGSIMYVKRLRANLFSDYAYGNGVRELKKEGITTRKGDYYSFGMDLVSDVHLFRFYFPFSLGIRISYLPTYRVLHPEMIFSIDTSVF